MKLWAKILIGLFLGIITGAILGPQAEGLKVVGQIFLRMINMIVVLLVLSSMTIGITSIHDPAKLGRVGGKTLLVYLVTTLISIAFGLGLGYIIQPGVGLALTAPTELNLEAAPKISEIILSIIPNNPVESLAGGHILQVIVFSVFLGMAINFAGEKGKPVLVLLESLADVMFRLTSIVMEFTPIGVFAIMAYVAGSFGIAVLLPLAKFLVGYYVGGIVFIGVVFCSILWFLCRLNPMHFFRGTSDAILVAFSTSSSSAALPVTMHCVQENLGVSKNISSFVIPLGSTVNMNGAAMFQGMAAVFVAQAYGIDLSMQQLLTIVFTATLSAVGAAGIPGTGFIMLSVVFQSVGLPVEGLAILAGIDRIREMLSASINVMGDAVTSVYVARQEDELDERQYYHEELVEMEASEL